MNVRVIQRICFSCRLRLSRTRQNKLLIDKIHSSPIIASNNTIIRHSHFHSQIAIDSDRDSQPQDINNSNDSNQKQRHQKVRKEISVDSFYDSRPERLQLPKTSKYNFLRKLKNSRKNFSEEEERVSYEGFLKAAVDFQNNECSATDCARWITIITELDRHAPKNVVDSLSLIAPKIFSQLDLRDQLWLLYDLVNFSYLSSKESLLLVARLFIDSGNESLKTDKWTKWILTILGSWILRNPRAGESLAKDILISQVLITDWAIENGIEFMPASMLSLAAPCIHADPDTALILLEKCKLYPDMFSPYLCGDMMAIARTNIMKENNPERYMLKLHRERLSAHSSEDPISSKFIMASRIALCNDANEAADKFGEMRDQGIRPNYHVWLALLTKFFEEGKFKLDHLEELLKHMKDTSNVEPRQSLFEAVLRQNIAKNLDEIMNVMTICREKHGLLIDKNLWRTFIKALCLNDNVEMAYGFAAYGNPEWPETFHFRNTIPKVWDDLLVACLRGRYSNVSQRKRTLVRLWEMYSVSRELGVRLTNQSLATLSTGARYSLRIPDLHWRGEVPWKCVISIVKTHMDIDNLIAVMDAGPEDGKFSKLIGVRLLPNEFFLLSYLSLLGTVREYDGFLQVLNLMRKLVESPSDRSLRTIRFYGQESGDFQVIGEVESILWKWVGNRFPSNEAVEECLGKRQYIDAFDRI